MSSENIEPASSLDVDKETDQYQKTRFNAKNQDGILPSGDETCFNVQSPSRIKPTHDADKKQTSKPTPIKESTLSTLPTLEHLFTPPSQPLPKAPTSLIQTADDDNLNFIKEQLNFLNNESGELATPIHKSNKQKRQELARKHQELAVKRKDLRSPAKQFLKLHCRGIKRSPQ